MMKFRSVALRNTGERNRISYGRLEDRLFSSKIWNDSVQDFMDILHAAVADGSVHARQDPYSPSYSKKGMYVGKLPNGKTLVFYGYYYDALQDFYPDILAK